jgi:hypothetical protein
MYLRVIALSVLLACTCTRVFAQSDVEHAKDAATKSQAANDQTSDASKDLTFGEQVAVSVIPVTVTGILGLIGIYVTNRFKDRSKSSDFSKLAPAAFNIHDTEWDGIYTGTDGEEWTGVVSFKQYGRRLVGKGVASASHRSWAIEGVLNNRRICYVYHDNDPAIDSFGTTMLEFNGAGDELTGTWNGWAPDGAQFGDLPIRFVKHKR